MGSGERQLHEHLTFLYGGQRAAELTGRLMEMLRRFQRENPNLAATSMRNSLSERDAILVTYGDMVQDARRSCLQSLADFLNTQLAGIVSTIHILPFFPYSSDDGFSVIDYQSVDPEQGTWDDIASIHHDFKLMFDAVINHISAKSEWFQGFLRGEEKYRDYFIEIDPAEDLSQVFRPRALPLCTTVQGTAGQKAVWTTFSSDQIDLNYHNPEVLLKVLETLLLYVAHGAEFIRLDAVAFIWKEPGTACIHLPQAHRIVKLIRSILEMVAPRVVIVTETNVPHKENISYFGSGDEAQIVYNFCLPPLTLHAFQTQNAEILSRWADALRPPSQQLAFLNFLASHDGIGLTPAKGILTDADIADMARRAQKLGGAISYKTNSDGSRTAYELNINYLDAMNDPANPNEDVEIIARRFLASQAIMLALQGVPGIYFHSLFGSRNWQEGPRQSGRPRTINRQKLQRSTLESELADPHSLRHKVFHGYLQLLKSRASTPAFHPNGGQQVIFCHKAVFALLRISPDGSSYALCLHNVSNRADDVSVALDMLPVPAVEIFRDILSGQIFSTDDMQLNIHLAPYQVLWLKNIDD